MTPGEPTQCEADVWKRDTYRVDRGTKSGFKMHYERCRCARKATSGGLCGQHAKLERSGMWLSRKLAQ